MTDKSTDDDDNGWNDNYDGDEDNIDEMDDKNYQKTYIYYEFTIFRAYCFVKKGQKIRAGASRGKKPSGTRNILGSAFLAG